MSGIHPPSFPSRRSASSLPRGGAPSDPCIPSRPWCGALGEAAHGTAPSSSLWSCMSLKCMSLTISQEVHDGCCRGCLFLMWLSRAGGRSRLAELLDLNSLRHSRAAVVPALDLSRVSCHRQSHCNHPWTSLNSWRSRTQSGHLL